IRSGAYRGLDYWNDQWTCWVKASDHETWKAFDPTALSNNHLVTDDAAVARRLRSVRIGDQIRFKGYLVDYSAPAGMRVSSTVRNDTGNGACEVVYVEDFDILSSPNRLWRGLFKAALFALLGSILFWAFLPPKFKD